jgi:hypothetical protein
MALRRASSPRADRFGFDEAKKLPLFHGQETARTLGIAGRRTGLLFEDGHLSEEISFPERGDLQVLAVVQGYGYAEGSGFHHEQFTAGITLLKESFPLAQLSGMQQPVEVLNLIG